MADMKKAASIMEATHESQVCNASTVSHPVTRGD